jgi:hypothetical protein
MSDPEPRPKRRRWRWLIAVVAVGFAVFAWLLRPAPPLFQFTTSDGCRISFLAAGLGKLDHRASSRAYERCYELLRSYGPAAIFRWIPSPKSIAVNSEKSRTGAESLNLLFEVQSDPASGKRYRLQDAVKLEFVDSNGHRVQGRPVRIMQTALGWEAHCYECFPRRDPRLSIHLTDLSSAQRTASFEIPNPGFRTGFPTWMAEPLPQTRTDPQVDVTLGELSRDSLAADRPLPIELAVHDPAWGAQMSSAWLEDATGNHGSDLSPFEPAWKARVFVARANPSSFSAAEKWSLGPFPLPQPGNRSPIGQAGQIGETRFNVTMLEFRTPSVLPVAVPRPSPAAGASPMASAANGELVDLTFHVEVRAFPRNAWLLGIVTDQAGQPLQEFQHMPPWMIPRVTQGVAVRFKKRPDTKQVSLTLIVSQPREFEFFVAPPIR